MERDGLRIGHLLALAGAIATLGALWLPWYELHLGSVGRAGFEAGLGEVPAPFRVFAEGLFDQIDGLRVSAWTVFAKLDVALAVGTGLVVATILAASGAAGESISVEPRAAARAASGAGLVLGVLVLFRMVDRPAPDAVLGLAIGAWVALGGCALMVVGGLLASGPPAARSVAPSPWDAPAAAPPRPPAPTSSVAPPPPR